VKSKVLKHICALSNSNPANNSYIVVGVEDQDNEIVGVIFDDSHIQNLVNAYLENPPKFNMKTSLSQLTKRQSDWTSDRKTKK
jgi:predicted HTH transcriptional regulator